MIVSERALAPATAPPHHPNPLLWPLVMAATATDAAAKYFNELAKTASDERASHEQSAPAWASANRIVLELTTMRLRDFSRGGLTSSQKQSVEG
jgi:hypothetical protein